MFNGRSLIKYIEVIGTYLKKLNCKIKKIKSGEYEVYGKGLGSLYCKKNTKYH